MRCPRKRSRCTFNLPIPEAPGEHHVEVFIDPVSQEMKPSGNSARFNRKANYLSPCIITLKSIH